MEIDWRNLLDIFFQGFTIVVMLFSLFGLIIPVFPGIAIIWLVAVVNVFWVGITPGGLVVIGLLSVFAILGLLIDNVVMGKVVRDKGAAWSSIFAALGAGLLGTLFFPPLGGLVLAPLVLFYFEYRRLGDRAQAIEVLKALALGWGWGAVARFGIGFLMVLTWAFWRQFG